MTAACLGLAYVIVNDSSSSHSVAATSSLATEIPSAESEPRGPQAATATATRDPKQEKELTPAETEAMVAHFKAELRKQDCYAVNAEGTDTKATASARRAMAANAKQLASEASRSMDIVTGGDDDKYLLVSTTPDDIQSLQQFAKTVFDDPASLAGLCNTGFYEVQLIVRGANLNRTLYQRRRITLEDYYEYKRSHAVTPIN